MSIIARLRLPRLTVRLRLTVLYGSLFLASGAALLAVTYTLVSRGVSEPSGTQVIRSFEVTAPGPGPTMKAMPGDGTVIRHEDAAPLLLSDVLHELLVNSGIALAVMAVISIVLGWIVAGRILRPLRTITTTVCEISATNLHRRLALQRPDDELKELGDTFDGLLARLESSFQAQRQFVANASHELRTPVTRQRVLGQVAIADPEASAASLRSAHERILVAGAQQERLIEALLTLSRGHAGIEVHEPIDLAETAREMLANREAEAEYREVTLRTSLEPAVASGHHNLAERLIINVVDNALRYNKPGGWVQVTTGSTAAHAVLTVVNTGPVVHPEQVDYLFQPFHRLDSTRSAKADGLGLGLSIVRAIADAHDAVLTVRPRREGGLTFEVAFPLETPGPPSPRLSLRASRVPG